MKGSWKSTVAGAFTAFFMFVLFSPQTFQAWPWLIELAKFAAIGGLAAMGILGKDFDKTGGTRS
jgi:hypothetical protein